MFFVPQVGEITTDLGKHQHMHDRDDLQAEQVISDISLFLAQKEADIKTDSKSWYTEVPFSRFWISSECVSYGAKAKSFR